MTNERLRAAMTATGLTYEEAGERLGVDPKTVQRWVSTARPPYRRYRQQLAKILGKDEVYLWPGKANSVDRQADSELIALYPTRSSVPVETWSGLLSGAKEHIDILAYAASFLWDAIPDFTGLIKAAAERGVQVRMLFGDPDCEAVKVRGEEEGIGDALAGRCRLTWKYVEPIFDLECIEARVHTDTLYTTVVRVDEDLLANVHQLGVPAGAAPVLHLKRITGTGIHASYENVLERSWTRARPCKSQSPTDPPP